MNFNFWKFSSQKPASKEPRILVIPEEQTEKILMLYDAAYKDKWGALAKYRFWKAIQEIFPEVVRGYWKPDFTNIWEPKIVEFFD